jgi:hypothetical protein
MEEHLLIAVIAALLNILFSILIPPLISNSKLPFTQEIKKHYECNKNFILVSTILIVVLVYISLKITPHIKSQLLGNVSALNVVSNVTIPQLPVSTSQIPVSTSQIPVNASQLAMSTSQLPASA